jgi:hypothetical protein
MILDASQAHLQLCYAGHQPSDAEYFHQELTSHFSNKPRVPLHETNTSHLQALLLTNCIEPSNNFHQEPTEAYNHVHFTRYPPEYHPGITRVPPTYQLSITQVLEQYKLSITHVSSQYQPGISSVSASISFHLKNFLTMRFGS